MDSFTLTISHLQSPIFYLATVAAGSNLRPPFSIFDLTSGADGWALGSTIRSCKTGPECHRNAYTGTLSADARLAAHPTRSLGVI